jgi:hypothetical protein
VLHSNWIVSVKLVYNDNTRLHFSFLFNLNFTTTSESKMRFTAIMHAQGSPFCNLHRLFTALNSYAIGTVVKLKFSRKTLRCIKYSRRKWITVDSYLVSEFPFVDINISGKNITVISTTKIFNRCESSQIELHPPLVGSFRFLPILYCLLNRFSTISILILFIVCFQFKCQNQFIL